MRLKIASLLTLVCAAVMAATAPAAVAAGKPLPPARTPASTVAPATVHLYVRGAYAVRGAAVTLPGRAFTVQGVVTPYVAGQTVLVRTLLGARVIRTDRLRLKPSPHGRFGAFTERVVSPAAGIVHVRVRHARSTQQRGFFAQRAVAVLRPGAGFGSRGLFVSLIQQRLAALRIYVPQTGVYDTQTGLALDAYHRLLHRGVSQQLDGATISALLAGQGRFHVRFPKDGTHIEGNLSQQLLAEITGDRVDWIYPISSGKPSTPTVLGHFRVYRRTPGYLPDGMYYSSFFYGGYAIHGYNPAPDYPASHGCMRLPIIDAISVYDWLRMGDVVDVYR